MNEPDTQYARLDGYRIAYQIIGEGPVDLIWCADQASIDAEWDEPEIALFNRRLGEIGRLIRFDGLGSGASDPIPPGAPRFEEFMSQTIETVLDTVGSERAILLTGDAGVAGALLIAARQPDRVVGMLVFHGAARIIAAEDYPEGMAVEELDMWESLYDTMDVDQILRILAPSRASDEQFLRWGRKWLRNLASPATVQESIRQAKETDLRDILGSITAPTIVMHRTDYHALPMALSQYLADHIPNARFVEIPGADGPPWFEHPGLVLDAVRELVQQVAGESAPNLRTQRVMATVLFTDLVGSTEKAQEVGDAEWRNLLQLHEEVSVRCVKDSGGKLIKTTGDGILATFDSPTGAIQCAVTISRNLARVGLPIRAGIHTGEVEVRDGDVGGIAVHIAARVMAAAGTGEVLVSRTVRDLVAGSGLSFTDRGAHSLKGVDGEWELFALAPSIQQA